MTELIQHRLALVKQGAYKRQRRERVDATALVWDKSPLLRDALLLKASLEAETPFLFPNDRIGFTQSRERFAICRDRDGNEIWTDWSCGNNTPDYAYALNNGLDHIQQTVAQKRAHCLPQQKEYYDAVLIALDAVLAFADRCRDDARKAGADDLYRALCRVPHQKPQTFREALVMMKLLIFTLRANRNIHLTIGRFDQYMYPFYRRDVKAGISRETLLELLEEFFLSLNVDTDTYMGAQQGDNGQSLVLGGCDKDGNDAFNDLSRLCMEASMELCLIDPKINLRVNKNTPDELYELGTQMTKLGLGFPQYSNDDVVIPGLIALGYAPQDAADYAVAACWEFTIPGKGMEIPNLRVMNFPLAVLEAVTESLLACDTFDELLAAVKERICIQSDNLMAQAVFPYIPPSPYLSVFVEGCLEKGLDVSQGGAVYKNYGLLSAGISTAADSLAAINNVIYQVGDYDKQTLLDALAANFEGYAPLRNRLLDCPKMGNNDDAVDTIAGELMETFASHVNGKPHPFGGVFRAGTGSAQGYYTTSVDLGATPDGRKAGEMFGCGFSPSLVARVNGPLSCIQSFTKFDLSKIINGGPLTLEIHDTVFRNGEGISKVAQLVKFFILRGGHQLQLNTINRDVLLDALAHPENHRNLIVRVWGWSGYFNELDVPFQQHILKRTEFTV